MFYFTCVAFGGITNSKPDFFFNFDYYRILYSVIKAFEDLVFLITVMFFAYAKRNLVCVL